MPAVCRKPAKPASSSDASVELAGRRATRHLLRRGQDLGPAAIGEGDVQVQARTLGRARLGVEDGARHVRPEAGTIADHLEADPLLDQRGYLRPQVVPQQSGQVAHLVRRALPVLGGEGEKGQPLYPGLGRGLDRAAHGLGPGLVAHGARQPAGGGPAAVAVHDDSDVAGHAERLPRLHRPADRGTVHASASLGQARPP
jgi:hypothetical protein